MILSVPEPFEASHPTVIDRYLDAGITSYKNNEVAAVLLAGGTASRMGLSKPKGLLKVNKKSLFQIQCEKILDSGFNIPLYVLGSTLVSDEVTDYFLKNNNFGLDKVKVFSQGNLPLLRKNSVSSDLFPYGYEPNGHGGLFKAMESKGIFLDMLSEKIKYVVVFQIDNPMAQFIDPVFHGIHVSRKTNMTSKVVLRNKNEPCSTVLTVNGKLEVTDWRELEDESLAKLGYINVIMFDIQFMQLIALYPDKFTPKHDFEVDREGVMCKKSERVIMDPLKYAEKPDLLLVDRNFEFSPIKEKYGPYSISAAENALHKLTKEIE